MSTTKEIIEQEHNFNYHKMGRLIKKDEEIEPDNFEQFKQEFVGNGLFRSKNDLQLRETFTNPETITLSVTPTGDVEANTELTFIADSNILGDITDNTTFKVNGDAIEGNSYTVTEPGEYIITAVYNEIESNEISVTCLVPEVITLSVSPTGDVEVNTELIFTTISNRDGDVTDTTTFKVNGDAIEGNSYIVTEPGEYTITTNNSDDEISVTCLVPEVITVSVTPTGEVEVGTELTFTATSSRDGDVTNDTTFTVNGDAIPGNTYTTISLGNFTVVGTYNGKTDDAEFEVI